MRADALRIADQILHEAGRTAPNGYAYGDRYANGQAEGDGLGYGDGDAYDSHLGPDQIYDADPDPTATAATMVGAADEALLEPDALDGTPGDEGEPHPGLEELVQRSERRTRARVAPRGRRIASTSARAIKQQTRHSWANLERDAASAELRDTPGRLPAPILGAAFSRNRIVVPVVLLVFIPLEAMLTYPQLLVLGMSDAMTMVFAALIGITLAVIAEVVGFLLHHIFTADPEDEDGGGPVYYWLIAGLIVLVSIASWVTIDQLAEAREKNEKIVLAADAREDAIQDQLANGATDLTATPPEVTDEALDARTQIDLQWTFPLQLLAMLGAAVIAFRKRAAEDYNEVEIERARRSRRSRAAERSLRVASQKQTMATARYDGVLRDLRSDVEEERALLLELFQRTRRAVRAVDPTVPVAFPRLDGIDAAVERAARPYLPRTEPPQLAASPDAVLPEPPHPLQAYAPIPDDPTNGGPAPAPAAAEPPRFATQSPLREGWSLLPGIGWVYIQGPNAATAAPPTEQTAPPVETPDRPVSEPASPVEPPTPPVDIPEPPVDVPEPGTDEDVVGSDHGLDDWADVPEDLLDLDETRPVDPPAQWSEFDVQQGPEAEAPETEVAGTAGSDEWSEHRLSDVTDRPDPTAATVAQTPPPRRVRRLAPPGSADSTAPYRDTLRRIRDALDRD